MKSNFINEPGKNSISTLGKNYLGVSIKPSAKCFVFPSPGENFDLV